jgi:hypothetical protein
MRPMHPIPRSNARPRDRRRPAPAGGSFVPAGDSLPDRLVTGRSVESAMGQRF